MLAPSRCFAVLLSTAFACAADPSEGANEETGSTGGGGSSYDAGLPDVPTNLDETLAIYGAAWGEADPDRRLALLELAWADDGLYMDPTVTAPNRRALSDAIGTFLEQLPGSTFVIETPVDRHGDAIRFDWMLDGPMPLPGMDVGEIGPDQRLVRITGFFGPMPAVGTPSPAVEAFVSAWGEPDDAARLDLLREAMVPEATFTDAMLTAATVEDLSEHIGAELRTAPGGTRLLTGGPDAYGSVARWTWTNEGDGTSGLDFVELAADGRLASVIAFAQ